MSASTATAWHGEPFLTGRDTAPAYWAFGVLWVILVDSEPTGGNFSVMEQWMPAGDGPPAHVHPIDEWFEVLEGTIVFHTDGREITARAGDSVWMPHGTAHTFTLQTAAHVLNGYTPGVRTGHQGPGHPGAAPGTASRRPRVRSPHGGPTSGQLLVGQRRHRVGRVVDTVRRSSPARRGAR